MLALIALALMGVAVAALVWGVVLPKSRADLRVREIDVYGYGGTMPTSTAGDERQATSVRALAQRLGDIIGGRLGTSGDTKVRRELLAAGMYTLTPRALVGYQALAAGAGLAYGLLTDIIPNLSGPFLDAAALAAVGWLLPITWVRRTGRLRLDRIDRALPDVIDLVVVSVEAGQGFAQALDTAAQRTPGSLGEELRLTLQEQRFGLPMERALEHLNDRADTPNMRTFVRAVVQGERLGVSIGQIMRNVSHEMRLRRRQAAEEHAQKTTVKILFPLVFLVLPALFIVVLAPAVLGLGDLVGD
jgi:tight adherence protein C